MNFGAFSGLHADLNLNHNPVAIAHGSAELVNQGLSSAEMAQPLKKKRGRPPKAKDDGNFQASFNNPFPNGMSFEQQLNAPLSALLNPTPLPTPTPPTPMTTEEPPKKRGRGRPPKDRTPEEQAAHKALLAARAAKRLENPQIPGEKRGRGRPRKIRPEEAGAAPAAPTTVGQDFGKPVMASHVHVMMPTYGLAVADAVPVKKGRGRPPKNKTEVAAM